jgi:hypothetical protein
MLTFSFTGKYFCCCFDLLLCYCITGGPYSRLIVSFHFKRLMGSFVIEVYAPGSLLVIMSWWVGKKKQLQTTFLLIYPISSVIPVSRTNKHTHSLTNRVSFWINREASEDRVNLGNWCDKCFSLFPRHASASCRETRSKVRARCRKSRPLSFSMCWHSAYPRFRSLFSLILCSDPLMLHGFAALKINSIP